MEPHQKLTRQPLQHLDYFMEWGGKAWQRPMEQAFHDFIGTDLHDQQVLEIGTRRGKMACLFALLGATVVGLDISKKSLVFAREEATKLNVADRTSFILSGGDLAAVSANTFDIVFSKSVLVVVPDLVRFLEEVKEKLKPGGKIVFLENAKGPWWVHLLRTFRHHGKWDYTRAQYFTSHEIKAVSTVFDEFVVRSWAFPPIVLMMGRKPNADNRRTGRSSIEGIFHAHSATAPNSPVQISP